MDTLNPSWFKGGVIPEDLKPRMPQAGTAPTAQAPAPQAPAAPAPTQPMANNPSWFKNPADATAQAPTSTVPTSPMKSGLPSITQSQDTSPAGYQATHPWSNPQAQTPTDAEPKWGDLPGNIIPSLKSNAEGLWDAVSHPIRTGTTMGQIGAGALETAGDWATGTQSEPTAEQQAFNGAVDFFKNRYGSMESLKKTMITDPVGFATDLASVIDAGGSAVATVGEATSKLGEVSKVAEITKAGQKMQEVGTAARPIAQAGKFAKQAAADAFDALKGETGGAAAQKGLTTVGGVAGAGQEGLTTVGEVKPPQGVIAKTIKGVGEFAGQKSNELYESVLKPTGKGIAKTVVKKAKELGIAGTEGSILRKTQKMIDETGKKIGSWMESNKDKGVPIKHFNDAIDETISAHSVPEEGWQGRPEGSAPAPRTPYPGSEAYVSALEQRKSDAMKFVKDGMIKVSDLDKWRAAIGDRIEKAGGWYKDLGTTSAMVDKDAYHAIQGAILEAEPEFAGLKKDYHMNKLINDTLRAASSAGSPTEKAIAALKSLVAPGLYATTKSKALSIAVAAYDTIKNSTMFRTYAARGLAGIEDMLVTEGKMPKAEASKWAPRIYNGMKLSEASQQETQGESSTPSFDVGAEAQRVGAQSAGSTNTGAGGLNFDIQAEMNRIGG